MIINSVEVRNYRNYESLSMEFHPGTNLLYGDNAQGKTNILEAVYLCSTTKSHRGSRDKEIIKMGEDEAHIRMQTCKNEICHTFDMHLKKNKSKGIAIDGIPIKKSAELVGMVPIVFFSPEDLSIIKNGPGERRRFIDMELCQLDKIYLFHLTKYNKIIAQRNNLLRQIGFKRELLDTLSIWDKQLVEYGSCIIKKRMEFLEEINEIIRDIHKKLSGGREDLILQYEPSTEETSFKEKLEKSLERDLHLKMTGIGPHRDDIVFLINGIDVRKYGSQGQQRCAALSLKLAEIKLLTQTIKNKPILLLDDVLSELDRNRQNYLLESIENIQTIITCTGLEEFVNNNVKLDKVYRVSKGKVEEKAWR